MRAQRSAWHRLAVGTGSGLRPNLKRIQRALLAAARSLSARRVNGIIGVFRATFTVHDTIILRPRSLSANGARQQQKLRGWDLSALWHIARAGRHANRHARQPLTAAHRSKKMQKLIVALALSAPRARRAVAGAAPRSGSTPRGDGRARTGGRAGAGRAREEDGHQQPQGHDHPVQIRGRPRPRASSARFKFRDLVHSTHLSIFVRPPGARLRAEPHRGLPTSSSGRARRVEHGDRSASAPGRAQARLRRDGRLRRLPRARAGHHVRRRAALDDLSRIAATASIASFTQVALQDDARRRPGRRSARAACARLHDPEGAKWQIVAAIGCLEWYEWQYDNPAAEMPAMADKPHYTRGGQPGIYRGNQPAVTAKCVMA